jgi:hypothetical protein
MHDATSEISDTKSKICDSRKRKAEIKEDNFPLHLIDLSFCINTSSQINHTRSQISDSKNTKKELEEDLFSSSIHKGLLFF